MQNSHISWWSCIARTKRLQNAHTTLSLLSSLSPLLIVFKMYKPTGKQKVFFMKTWLDICLVNSSHTSATDQLSPSHSVLSSHLHLSPVVPAAHPHFFFQISLPSIAWLPSSSVALRCSLQRLLCNAVITSSQHASKIWCQLYWAIKRLSIDGEYYSDEWST